MTPEAFRFLAKPAWLGVIIFATLAAGGASLWMGLQQDTKQTATTFVFGRRVGYLDRQIPELENHLDAIVSAVEFPAVFEAIEKRTGLSSKTDYEFTIERLEDTQSVVEIVVRADRAGDAERIARILAEEVVEYVLDTQGESLAADVGSIDGTIRVIEERQSDLRRLAEGVSPVLARNSFELQLLALNPADGPIGNLQAEIQSDLRDVRPLADLYDRNAFELKQLREDRARALIEQLDVQASSDGINGEWYRSITPVEAASNLPIAIAMAFAAAVPAALISVSLVMLNLNRRVSGRRIGGSRTEPLPI